jgi:hypothetical protein
MWRQVSLRVAPAARLVSTYLRDTTMATPRQKTIIRVRASSVVCRSRPNLGRWSTRSSGNTATRSGRTRSRSSRASWPNTTSPRTTSRTRSSSSRRSTTDRTVRALPRLASPRARAHSQTDAAMKVVLPILRRVYELLQAAGEQRGGATDAQHLDPDAHLWLVDAFEMPVWRWAPERGTFERCAPFVRGRARARAVRVPTRLTDTSRAGPRARRRRSARPRRASRRCATACTSSGRRSCATSTLRRQRCRRATGSTS